MQHFLLVYSDKICLCSGIKIDHEKNVTF